MASRCLLIWQRIAPPELFHPRPGAQIPGCLPALFLHCMSVGWRRLRSVEVREETCQRRHIRAGMWQPVRSRSALLTGCPTAVRPDRRLKTYPGSVRTPDTSLAGAFSSTRSRAWPRARVLACRTRRARYGTDMTTAIAPTTSPGAPRSEMVKAGQPPARCGPLVQHPDLAADACRVDLKSPGCRPLAHNARL